MKVYWTAIAEKHLDSIYSYIAQNSIEYAIHIVDRLTAGSQQIAAFPLSGCSVPEYSSKLVREVIEGSYRIIYYTKPEQIDILAVIHGAQNIKPNTR